MSGFETIRAEFGSREYLESIQLRRRVLRLPLGLDFTPEQLESERTEFHLVGLQDGHVIACLVLTPQAGGDIKMRQVAVEPEQQGRGVGRRLVKFSETLAANLGFVRMVLNARDTAVPFYLAQGYEVVGEPFVEVTIPHRHMSKDLGEGSSRKS